MASRHRAPRLVLGFGILVGVVYAVGLASFRPGQVGIASDVYHHAAEAALAGGDFYAVHPPGRPNYRFLYPPIVVFAFVPHALAGTTGALLIQTVLNVVAAAGVGWLSVRTVESAGVSLDRVDRGLLLGFALLATPTAANLVMGQVNPLLALGIAAGAVLVERDREASTGAAFGLAAAVKPFPAVAGAWLLRRRAWTAVAAATATGAVVLLAGALVLGPETTATYVTEVLAGEAGTGDPEGRYEPGSERVTVRRQVAFLAPWLPGPWRLAVGAALLAPVVLATYRDFGDPVDRLAALAATLVATLLLFPLEPFYVVLALYPVLPLAYLLDGWPRQLLLAGIVLVTATVTLFTVREGVALLGVPTPVADPLLAVTRTAFAVAIPPTIGAYLLLAACLAGTWPGTESRLPRG